MRSHFLGEEVPLKGKKKQRLDEEIGEGEEEVELLLEDEMIGNV